MRTRADYDRAIEIIGDVIRRWDPFQLIAGGAPKDEFDGEVERLVTHVPRIHSADEMTKAVSVVFSGAFSPEEFTEGACAEVGAELYARLSEAGLVECA